MKIKRRTALPVRVSKPGYATRTVRMPFKQRRQVTVRLFRDSLQWTMYGANNRRTQAHADIKLRPPFKVVWSRGVGALDRVPRRRHRRASATSATTRATSTRSTCATAR